MFCASLDIQSRDGSNHQALKEQRQTAFAACQTPVHESDTRDDEPDNEATENQVGIMVFEAAILGVDIDFSGLSTPWLGWVVGGLAQH